MSTPAVAPRRRTRRVSIPECRDPFINTPLISLGRETAGAPERFWISTWNSVTGCLGALVDEEGACRLYRFYDPKHPGFYSAAPEDADTLWLCGNLAQVVRLTLNTGEYEAFPTGAPAALVFHGMAFDPATRKLFLAAYPQTPSGAVAVSFDVDARQSARVYEGAAPDYYMHGSFPLGDGTYGLMLEIPGSSLVRWDPRAERVETRRLSDEYDVHHALETGSNYQVIQDDRQRPYFPHLGWYDPAQGEVVQDGPRPQKEMTWFGRRDAVAWGARWREGDLSLGRWEMGSGAVEELARIPDAGVQSVRLTKSGKIVCVSIYGEFTRRDAETGRLECSRRLPATSIQHTDCLCRIYEDRLLGTPFITQRFWEVNLKSGAGFDCGRAAPGAGEILQTWDLNGKIYMAEYGGGRLVEYDPKEHPHFPENPRVVANPPDSMRPIAAADDGRHLFYFCSAPYGRLGSTLTRYDTVTGSSVSSVNPVPGQRFASLCYDPSRRALLAGSSYNADCMSCPPSSSTCYLARFSAGDLGLLESTPAPEGTQTAAVLGPLGPERWLCRCVGQFAGPGASGGGILLALDGASFALEPLERAWPVPADWQAILYAGSPGLYAVHRGARVELWDLRERTCLEVLTRRAAGRRLLLDADALYLVGERDIVVMDGVFGRCGQSTAPVQPGPAVRRPAPPAARG